jgi:hypothetical protein
MHKHYGTENNPVVTKTSCGERLYTDRLNITSSTASVPFLLDAVAEDACTTWVDVKDSLAGTYDIYAENAVDSGGNDEDWSTPFWIFDSCPAVGGSRSRIMIINTED